MYYFYHCELSVHTDISKFLVDVAVELCPTVKRYGFNSLEPGERSCPYVRTLYATSTKNQPTPTRIAVRTYGQDRSHVDQ